MKVPDINYQDEIKKCKSIDDVVGWNGLMQRLLKDVMQQLLEAEGAKFWLSVCNDLNNRGVKNILIACMDGLRGLPDAIRAVFPKVCIQNCIIHQIRNSIKYVSYKTKKNL